MEKTNNNIFYGMNGQEKVKTYIIAFVLYEIEYEIEKSCKNCYETCYHLK